MTSPHSRQFVRFLSVAGRTHSFVSLEAAGVPSTERLPVSLRILLENVLRGAPPRSVRREVEVIRERSHGQEVSFRPVRVALQDLLGVPALVDLAALRDAVARVGSDPMRVNPSVPVTLVIDHSLRADVTADPSAPDRNLALEYDRNGERFAFLRWCQTAFRNLEIVPPGKGILHQVNLESIARVIWTDENEAVPRAFPDTLVGTDSHTTMINGLGVLGWGVGGIEAEAVMLGRPLTLALPPVVGVEVTGRMPEGVTATDLVLAVTERMRRHGVVGKFVEFFGRGLQALPLADRATVASMAPEYGATCVLFPIDRHTVEYLRHTGRGAAHIALVEAYARAQGLWADDAAPTPEFDEVITVDLGSIRPSIAGPRRPEDRINLNDAASEFERYAASVSASQFGRHAASVSAPHAADVPVEGMPWRLPSGAVVIAAITSCTNTSNPGAMATAGLLARKAVGRGLRARPWVKTSFAPGSQAIAAFLRSAGLQEPLDALGFHVIGFGCTTCNGMSGPIPPELATAIEVHGLLTTAVLSGNRNFEGRIHPNVRAAYLASPALVVGYALAGAMTVDLSRDPLGTDREGRPVFLADLWPSDEEVAAVLGRSVQAADFTGIYARLYQGDERWASLPAGSGTLFSWDDGSTYIRRPPYFEGLPSHPANPSDLVGLRPLVILGDSITTDHISPSGAIAVDSPAGRHLIAHGVAPEEFNSYGTRRGNHEVGMRATFANIRLRNKMVPGREGGFTRFMPDDTVMSVFDAAQEYARRGIALVVVAGRDYGCGSSRDWAAKGVALLGVRAVVAESFERIHRSNLIGMGVLPLQFSGGIVAEDLALDGSEVFDVVGLAGGVRPGLAVTLRVHSVHGTREVAVRCRIDTDEEAEIFRHGGILPAVWRSMTARPPAG